MARVWQNFLLEAREWEGRERDAEAHGVDGSLQYEAGTVHTRTSKRKQSIALCCTKVEETRTDRRP